MKKENQIPFWVILVFCIGIYLLLAYVFPVLPKATTVESPSMNLFTHSNMADTEADTTLPFWNSWQRKATGSTSAGELYFGHGDSNFIYTYFNTGELYGYSVRSADITALLAWAGEDGLCHWGTTMKQNPSNNAYLVGQNYYPTYSLRPGWNPSYDVNPTDGVRDTITDYNHNWNNVGGQVNFTVSTSGIYCIRDVGGGKSGVTWGTNTWQNGVVLMGTTESDTVRRSVTRSTPDSLILASAPPSGVTFYIVDKSRTWNPLQCANNKADARVYIYYGCDKGEPSHPDYCDTSQNTVVVNMSNTNIQTFWAHEAATVARTWRAFPYSGKVGNFGDNQFTDIRCGDKTGCGNDFGDGANSLVESGMRTNEGYTSAQRLCNIALNDSIHSVSGQTGTVGNVGEYKTDQYPGYMQATRPLNAVFYELVMDIEISLANCVEWKNTFDDAHDSGQQVFLMMKNSGYDDDNDSLKRERWLRGAGIYYTLLGHRNHRDTLANFLFMCDHSSGGPATIDTLEWWRPEAKFNIGTLAGICSTYTSGRSCFYRRYTNGIALFYPPQGGSLVVPLGRYYRRVLSNGTLSADSVNSYTMNDVAYGAATGGMGRIFGINATYTDSLIQHLTPPTPLYPVNGSMIWRDSLINLWGPPTDSVRFRVGTYNSFDSLFWKVSLIGADTGNLVVTGLLENTTYYYSAFAFEGSHRDTTAIASLTTTQAPVVAVDKKIRRWRK